MMIRGLKTRVSMEIIHRDKDGNVKAHYKEKPDGTMEVIHGNDG
jgi:hypothetical protein